MRKMLDLSGKRFGHWTVQSTRQIIVSGRGRTMNDCRCDCGAANWIRSDHLLAGRSTGCARCARTKTPNVYTFKTDGSIQVYCGSGDCFVIDEPDFPLIKKYQWCKHGRYFSTTDSGRRILLHRLLLGVEDVGVSENILVDHISGDASDNRRCNLRRCGQSDNSKNQLMSKSNSSGFKGVYKHKIANKYVAQITSGYENRYLGMFATPEDAAAAYDRAAVLYHGEFARTNKMLGVL